MSNIVLNKVAKRPPKVIVTRVVFLYRCFETGVEHHKWMDFPVTIHENEIVEVAVPFDEFSQFHE
jgi:hypothetical protein